MTIQRGDYVRPNNHRAFLPLCSVWRVVCSAGALKLEPANSSANRVGRWATYSQRFHELDFDRVVLCHGQWVAVNGTDFQNLPETQTSTVSSAEANLTNAANATAGIEGLWEAAPKLEAEREAEVQAAKLAKAKADKGAAAKAKAEGAKRQLAARLHADRCLGEATLALIAEVSRLNNGGAEQIAAASIAAHVGQLRALAKSYGYRIVKPGAIAIVVKA